MRGELIEKLFQAFVEGNREKFLQAADEIIKVEERKSHHLLVKDLRNILKNTLNNTGLGINSISRRYKSTIPIPRDTEKGFPLLELKEFYLDWNDVILKENSKSSLKQIIAEIKQSDILSSYGLKPKQKILFCGPPGTGKTLTSQVLSSVLRYPLVYIRFDSIVSSYLGETALNLRKIFNFLEQGQWVVLFDEFDIIGKHRDDPHEHGEIKRIVNNFMQMLDNYQGESLLIAATNHQYLLDPALWRRFDEILFFDLPDKNRRSKIFQKYLRVMEKEKDVNLNAMAQETGGFSPSEIAQICQEALIKALLEDKKQIGMKHLQWAIGQQKRRKKVKGRRNTNG